MSASAERSCSVSSISSISLLEIKSETHLVLKAFLHRTLTIPLAERPGRIGGAYKDYNKCSANPQPQAKDGGDSKVEDVSPTDEKKTGFKDFIKQLPHRTTTRLKDPKGSLDRDSKAKPSFIRDQLEDDVISPSSTSEEEDTEKKKNKKQKKIRRRISKFFRLKIEKDKDKDKEKEAPGSHPQNTPVAGNPPNISSNHPPEFYEEVAEKLEKIAQRSASIKKVTTISRSSTASEKEKVVQRLVQVLSLEGDSLNTKIQSDPMVRSSLARLSYASFARLMDTFSSGQIPDPPALPPAASPTLQRMAVSMEVSRRIVTATGTHRMHAYAECYMETFAPWVKSQGGWDKVIDLEDAVEYD